MRTRTCLVVIVVVLFGWQGVSSARTAATPMPSQIIGKLNAQRRANGIPADITVNSTWSTDCKKHDIYMNKNNTLTHFEVAGQPGYTKGGAWAGQNSVLAMGISWANGDPYEFAPIHLAQLL